MSGEDFRLRADEAAADLGEVATRLARRCGVPAPDLPPLPPEPQAVLLAERLGDFLGDLDARLPRPRRLDTSQHRPAGRID